MSILRRNDLNSLLQERANSCVSIYLPTHPAMPETQQDPIRFKNLLSEAEKSLATAGLRANEVKDFLEPATRLLADHEFWAHQSNGLAVFLSPNIFRFYTLPITFPELVVVTNRFHLKQLLRLFARDGSFYVLALSQNQVRLFQGSQQTISELFPQGIPQSLAEALKYDDPERQLQFHTRAAQAGGRRDAVFHGHGVGTDDSKDQILRYCREIDAGLHPLLKDEKAPLVLACVDYLLPIYREANNYPHLVEEAISGNPESLNSTELHAEAWKILQPRFQKSLDETIAKYRQRAGTGLTSVDVSRVISAAANGRVESLLVAAGVNRWGKFDPANNACELHDEAEPGDEDLLDRAAVETLVNGGTVFAVEPDMVPEGAQLAALFRY